MIHTILSRTQVQGRISTVIQNPTTQIWKKARVWSVVIAMTAALPTVCVPAILAPQTASAAGYSGCISAGSQLLPGDRLTSLTGAYNLSMQGDGNLVLYTSSNHPLWRSDALQFNQQPAVPGARLSLQAADGNLVIYSSSNVALWSAYTQNNPGDRLCLQDDGNLVVYSSSNVALWATMSVAQNAGPYGGTLTYNPGASGQCTYWAEVMFSRWTGTFINTLGINGTNGNARYWASNATVRGWHVGSNPRIGSVAVFQPYTDGAGSVGHVAFVTQYYPSSDTIVVSEMNMTAGWNKVDARYIPHATNYPGLQYIYADA